MHKDVAGSLCIFSADYRTQLMNYFSLYDKMYLHSTAGDVGNYLIILV